MGSLFYVSDFSIWRGCSSPYWLRLLYPQALFRASSCPGSAWPLPGTAASDPDIFVLDEPTTGMDATTKSDFYELMHHSAHHHQKSVLMITHDPEEVNQFADRNIHLVRDQSSPWRCFNVHDTEGEGDHA